MFKRFKKKEVTEVEKVPEEEKEKEGLGRMEGEGGGNTEDWGCWEEIGG